MLKALAVSLMAIGLALAADPGQQKLETMRKLEASSYDGVIELTAKQYR